MRVFFRKKIEKGEYCFFLNLVVTNTVNPELEPDLDPEIKNSGGGAKLKWWLCLQDPAD